MQDSPARVLLIEDDPADVFLVERSLGSDGPSEVFSLESVSTLREGLARLAERETDVLLLDLNLPDSRGTETLGQIRKHNPELPVVVLTGAGDDQTAFRALREADDYFVKGECTEASLRRSIRNARERVRIRTENELLHERIARDQKLESLRDMARGIAHDFNNLFTVILGNAAPNPSDPPLDASTQRRLRAIGQAAKVASELTRQLLAYAGWGATHFKAVDLSAHVRQIESLMQASLSRNVRLTLDLAQDLPAAQADPSALHQLLLNLLINAAESIGDANGTVTIRTGETRLAADDVLGLVPESRIQAGRCVFLEARDSGCGMEEEVRARAFDPFFSTKFSGRGLGLAVVMAIVRSHQAGVRLESEPGAGTRIAIFLPASGEAPQPVENETVLAGSGRVLLVDDDEGAREAIRYMLQGYGYAVLEAESGPRAIELLRDRLEAIDLALVDLTMPGLDGAETLAALRKLRPDLKAILTSGYGADEMARRCASLAGVGFLQKPYEPSELAASLKEALEEEP